MVALVFVYLLSLCPSSLTMLKQIGATHCKLSAEFTIVCIIHHFRFAPAQHLACTFLHVRFSSWWLTYFQHSPQVIAHTCTFLILSRLLHQKKLCIMRRSRLLFEHCSLTVGFGARCETCTPRAAPFVSYDIGAPSD